MRSSLNRPLKIQYWFFALLLSRIFFYFLGLRYDGNRLIETFMQFPDSYLLNLSNFQNIFYNFHASAPGLPLLYILAKAIGANNWWMIVYFLVFLLGVFANFCLYKFLVQINFSSIISCVITLFTLGLNPSIIVYEAQFYSTAIVAYSLVIILYLLIFNKTQPPYILLVILLLTNLVMMRSSYLLYLVLPLCVFVIKRLFPLNSITKSIVLFVSVSILIIPISAQTSRIIKYGLPTMQASGSTGVLLGLSSFPTFKGFPYAPRGYFPFSELSFKNVNSKQFIPDINDSPQKLNGLPNWNYDGYLDQFKLDNQHFLETIGSNADLVVPFVAKSIAWSLTNPACSRVILSDNYSSLSFLDNFPRDLIMLRSPWKFENSQLSACGGSSSFDFAFLVLLLLYIFLSMAAFLKFFLRPKDNSDTFLVLLNLAVFASILVSILNGSPEVSKYRLETESYMFMMTIYLFSRSRKKFSFSPRNETGD